MTAPTMTWDGGADPEQPGKATFTVGEAKLEVNLTSFRDATVLQDMLTVAYRLGLHAGKRATAQLVKGALEACR